MTFEDLDPRPARGAAVTALGREDLDLYSVEELDERIEGLKAEIARCERARQGKQSQKSAADALFNFKS
ncbi:MAG: DUF1192 domain-containing protein [Brevundimonas sp.]